MMARIISFRSKLKASEIVWMTSTRIIGYGQLNGRLRHIPEHATDGLTWLISLDISEDVILQHVERGGCNLRREAAALSFAKVQNPLGLSERDLDGPKHRVYFVCFAKGRISGEQCIPIAISAVEIEEEFYRCTNKVRCPSQ